MKNLLENLGRNTGTKKILPGIAGKVLGGFKKSLRNPEKIGEIPRIMSVTSDRRWCCHLFWCIGFPLTSCFTMRIIQALASSGYNSLQFTESYDSFRIYHWLNTGTIVDRPSWKPFGYSPMKKSSIDRNPLTEYCWCCMPRGELWLYWKRISVL